MNLFELYEIPETISIDREVVQKKFFELSKKFHPDFFANATEEEQAKALEMSTLNTNALNTFKDKIKTIEYILKIHGYLEDIEKEKLPADFLMEMMEINEKLMELEMDFHMEEFNAAKASYKQANEALKQALIPIEEEFENGNPGEETYKKLKDFYLKNKYLLRIKETLNKFAAHS